MRVNHTAYLNLRDYEKQGKYKTAAREGSCLSLFFQGTRNIVNPLAVLEQIPSRSTSQSSLIGSRISLTFRHSSEISVQGNTSPSGL